jgi:hypothetical protein
VDIGNHYFKEGIFEPRRDKEVNMIPFSPDRTLLFL